MEQKMSKSDASDASRINLTDTKEEISNKIKKAKTDPHPLPETLEELSTRPEALNLINIYSSLSNQSIDQTLSQFFVDKVFLLLNLNSLIWP